jgi:hypothetical protein
MERVKKAVGLLIAGALVLACKDQPDPRLKDVTAVFVKGNNQAAEAARQALKSGKTCLALATKESDADATLEIGNDSQSMGGAMGGFGGRTNVVSGALTLKSGDLVWSRSERTSDAPFMSGAKTAGGLLISHLAGDSACKDRKQKR